MLGELLLGELQLLLLLGEHARTDGTAAGASLAEVVAHLLRLLDEFFVLVAHLLALDVRALQLAALFLLRNRTTKCFTAI